MNSSNQSNSLQIRCFFIANKKNFSHSYMDKPFDKKNKIDNFMFYVIGDCKDFYTFHQNVLESHTKTYIIKFK